MTNSFFDQPILNSPYTVPTRHHALDAEGHPLDEPAREGRRPSGLITPVPQTAQAEGQEKPEIGFSFEDELGQEYNSTPIINEIRQHLAS